MSNHTLLFGDEPFQIQRTVKQLEARHTIQQWTTFSETFNLEDLQLALTSIDMFTPERWILVKNPWFLKKKPDDKTAKAVKALLESVSTYPNHLVIICNSTLDKRLGLVKACQKHLKAQEFKSFQDWEMDKVLAWAKTYAQEERITIDSKALEHTLELSGSNLQIIAQELDKLTLYAAGQPITLQMVNQLCSSGTATLYDLNEAIKVKNKKSAISLLYTLLKQGEEPVKILGYITSSVRLYLQVMLLQQQRKSHQEIGKLVGKNPFFIKFLSQSIGNKYPVAQLKTGIQALATCDRLIKSGKQNPKIALQLTLLKVLA